MFIDKETMVISGDILRCFLKGPQFAIISQDSLRHMEPLMVFPLKGR